MGWLKKLSHYAKFLGRSVLLTQILGALGALLAAATELGVAAFIQLLLVVLGLSPKPTQGLLAQFEFTLTGA